MGGQSLDSRARSTFLVAQPSIATGVARILDVAGVFDEYNHSATGEEADDLAHYVDWFAIGDDMRLAISTYKPKH
jgi:hypothetical protein